MGKKKKKKKPSGLGTLPSFVKPLATEGPIDRTKLGFVVLSVGAGVLVGNALGNNMRSFGIAAVTTIGGIVTKNLYITAAGISMAGTAAIQDQTVNGLDFPGGAKARLNAFFNAFKEKFRLPETKQVQPSGTSVDGFGQVYTNPLAIDQGMQQLNEIERQLETMNGTTEEPVSDLPEREL